MNFWPFFRRFFVGHIYKVKGDFWIIFLGYTYNLILVVVLTIHRNEESCYMESVVIFSGDYFKNYNCFLK